jgi:hypothetical protein
MWTNHVQPVKQAVTLGLLNLNLSGIRPNQGLGDAMAIDLQAIAPTARQTPRVNRELTGKPIASAPLEMAIQYNQGDGQGMLLGMKGMPLDMNARLNHALSDPCHL